MSKLTANVNWLAVVIGAVMAFLMGWLWYSPRLFGTKWAEGIGQKMSDGSAMPIAPMVVQAIGTLLLSWIVGITAGLNALATIFLVAINHRGADRGRRNVHGQEPPCHRDGGEVRAGHGGGYDRGAGDSLDLARFLFGEVIPLRREAR